LKRQDLLGLALGSTQEETLAHASEAMQLWIDTLRGFGDHIPQRKVERFMQAWVGNRLARHPLCGVPADREIARLKLTYLG